MQKQSKGRAMLLAGVSAVVLGAVLPSHASTVTWRIVKVPDIIVPEPAKKPKAAKRATKKAPDSKSDKTPAGIPAGPLHIIVSVDAQRASLYANGTFVASTKVSTGTKTHPTPMGVFSVIQKNRHHISNLYNAPMPYMQRLTWSGTAMHTGSLPGYPASHGCIRLTDDFAVLLWKATKIGARVIVTREDVKPAEFAHERLFPPRPAVAALPPSPDKPPETTGALVRTADATNNVTGAVVQDAERPAETPATPGTPARSQEGLTDPRATVTEAVPSAQEIERRNSPVSIFVSRKDGKLYVRQAMQPLFDLPVTLRNPEQPIGTHVYTAMELKDGAMRWTAVSVPSTFREIADTDKNAKSSKKSLQPEKPAHVAGQKLSPSAALDRLDLPQEALEHLAGMIKPGASLIVSDNGIASETGRYTDFIVLTR
jgi:lipoprotein-anchoring transpeptidase ErfK/SrfK